MTDAVFFAHNDYANSGYWIAKALETQGLKACCWWQVPHEFRYPCPDVNYLQLHEQTDLHEQLSECKWIVVVQSDLPPRLGGGKGVWTIERHRFLRQYSDKRFVILHGGSYYRQKPERYQKIWATVDADHICYSSDLMGHFPKEHLIIPPMDMRYFPQVERESSKLVVGHFPARAHQKGTGKIVPILKRMAEAGLCEIRLPEFIGDKAVTVYWRRQLERIRECDIIIDQIYPDEKGKRVGEWVSLATEAAASGCITIANSHNPQPYVDTYGIRPRIRIVNEICDLDTELMRWFRAPISEVRDEQAASRRWVEQHHSLEPTGKLLVERVFH